MGQKPIEGSNPSLSANRFEIALAVDLHKAPVAQLDRAPGYEPGGREFESLRARQFSSTWTRLEFPSVEYSGVC
jgi:hypothetical protein